jgi:sporulation protein YlmC with PRC-barrel domain
VTVQQPAPHITVTQPNPDVKVTQPKPEVTVTPTKPDVTVQQAKPDVTVTQQKPEVTVQQKPDVNMQKPAVDKAAAADHRPLATDVQSLIGKEVYGQNGNHVGEIRNLLIGPGNRVQAAVIEFGGFLGIGENQVAVDWDRLNVQPNRVTINMTEDQIKSAPHWRKDEPGRRRAPAAITLSPATLRGGPERSSLLLWPGARARVCNSRPKVSRIHIAGRYRQERCRSSVVNGSRRGTGESPC